MNEKYFMRGIWCAGAGLILAQMGGVIGHGREPTALVPVLVLCLAGWLAFTIAAYVSKKHN